MPNNCNSDDIAQILNFGEHKKSFFLKYRKVVTIRPGSYDRVIAKKFDHQTYTQILEELKKILPSDLLTLLARLYGKLNIFELTLLKK